MDDDRIFAIDFTHEAMTASFVGPDGSEEGTAGFDLADFVAGGSEPLDKLLAMLAAKARAAQDKTLGVMVSIPADLDRERTRIVNFPAAPWLNNVPLPRLIAEALALPVLMERRSIVHLSYDMVMLGLPSEALVIGCYVDTHYENAVWHRGQPIFGRNGAAGNIAHMTIQDREDNCFCGKLGCVDLYGAGIRLRQLHTMIFPDTPIEELFVRHGEHPIVRDYLSMMAYPIAIESNIIDPEFVVLGGDIPSMRGFPRQFLEEEIARHSYSPEGKLNPAYLPSAASCASGVVPAAQYAVVKGF